MNAQQINHYLCGALREYDEEKADQHLLVMLAEIAAQLSQIAIAMTSPARASDHSPSMKI
jgi:hypothetical protein